MSQKIELFIITAARSSNRKDYKITVLFTYLGDYSFGKYTPNWEQG
jgi:hypothetical protein